MVPATADSQLRWLAEPWTLSKGVALTELFHSKKLALGELVRKMSTRPAEILKLPEGFGEIKVGQEANLTCVDLDQEWTVRKEEIISKSKNSCFNGKRLRGRAIATICRGKLWQFSQQASDADVTVVEK